MMTPSDRPCRDAAQPVPQDRLVHLSLSEINALCLKAARGAGLDWGEAEEAGWAASWLSRAGLAGPSITLIWLADVASLARPAPASGRWMAAKGAQCPLRCGIALADFADLPEGPGAHAITIERVVHPLMLLPFVARAAVWTGFGHEVRWRDHDVMPGATDLRHLADPTADEPADLWISRVNRSLEPDTGQDRTPPIPGIDWADWRALDTLALRITVPSSTQSRSGAGATGTDND